MSEPQHTPGPWIKRRFQHRKNRPCVGIYADDGSSIATTIFNQVSNVSVRGYKEHEMDANANLISAAPDLLEALETAWPFFEEDDGHGANSAAYQHAIDKARAAIAKAKGGEK